MPYILNWHDKAHTIVRLDMHGSVSWAEWYEAVSKLTEALAKTPYRLDFIFAESVGMPPGNSLPYIKTTMQKLGRYPNLGLVVLVSPRSTSTFVKAFLDMVLRTAPIDWQHSPNFVTTLDDAIGLIAKDRAEQKITCNA